MEQMLLKNGSEGADSSAMWLLRVRARLTLLPGARCGLVWNRRWVA